MSKFHINPESGEPGRCQAKKSCPYGDLTKDHYSTAEEARAAYEETKSAFDIFEQAMARRLAGTAMEKQIRYTRERKAELEESYRNIRKVEDTHEALPDDDASLQAYNEAYQALAAQATPEELEALNDYTGILYSPIKDYLTEPEAYRSRFKEEAGYWEQKTKLEETMKHLDSFLAKAPREPKVVYRAITADTTKPFDGSLEWADKLGIREGEEVTFPAYASTSLDPSLMNHMTQDAEDLSIVFVIETSRGAPVAPTALRRNDARYTQELEREYLLPRDTSYRVKKIQWDRFTHRDNEDSEPLTVYLEEL